MARRRTRKQSNAGCLSIAGVLIGLGIVVSLLQDAARHPGAGGAALAVVAVLGVGIGAIGWRVRKERERQAQLEYEIRLAQSQEIARYYQMDPKEFEHALAFLCARDGCSNVRVVGGAGDLGADVIAVAPDGRLVVLQAKRYGPTTKVSGPDLQKFGGTCFNVHRAQVAAVVTTSVFTRQAREYAGHMGIRLFDQQALAGWASRTGPTPWH